MYKILLAECDPLCRLVYKKMNVWSEYGFEIFAEAANGREALRLFEKECYDLLVSNIKMPVMNGIELLHQIRNCGNDIPVVYITSHTDFEYTREAILLGAKDFIKKPATEKSVGEMLGRIHKALSQAENNALSDIVVRIMEQVGADIDGDIFLRNVSLFLSDSLCDTVSMSETAEYFKMSKDYFGKCFKQHTGMSFNSVYTMIKMEYAKTLIDSGKYRNYEISEILGFCAPDYFTKLFKSVTGMTPREYKSRNAIS